MRISSGAVLFACVSIALLVRPLDAASVPVADKTLTLQHDGHTRTYHVHLPPGFNKAAKAPLALVLHGGGGSGKLFDKHMGGKLTQVSDKRGFVVVFPEGMNKQWSDGRKAHLKGDSGKKLEYDDVGFITKLIGLIQKEYGTDPNRVYATGISNGGFMSFRLAMDLSDRLVAIAPVTAQVSLAISNKVPRHPISVMIINGTEDPLVPFKGGHVRIGKWGRSRGLILSTEDTVERFRRHNGCRKKAVVADLPDRDPRDGAYAKTETYAGGKNGTEVILVRVVGGGHTWPGGKQYLPTKLVGPVCRDFNACELIFDFFLRHSKK